MKLLNAVVENYCTYSFLHFDYSDLGLTLVFGATGSGKSTLQDVPCWILYGITSKDGAVDDVRSWKTEEATKGILRVSLPDGVITVVRIRGRTSENDLYWVEGQDPAKTPKRGKDIKDTQVLLEKRLGVSADLYQTAAYASEFAPAGSFFTSKAKDRRSLLERIASLEFPVMLAQKLTENKKQVSKTVFALESSYVRYTARLEETHKSYEDAIDYYDSWEAKQEMLIAELSAKSKNYSAEVVQRKAVLQLKYSRFEQERLKELAALTEKLTKIEEALLDSENYDELIKASQFDVESYSSMRCKACDGPIHHKNQAKAQKELQRLLDLKKTAQHNYSTAKYLTDAIVRLKSSENPHAASLDDLDKSHNTYDDRLQEALEAKNPYAAQRTKQTVALHQAEIDHKTAENELFTINQHLYSLNTLYDLSFELRGIVLLRAVKAVEERTNDILEQYFDGELKVEFLMEADSLNVNISKSGYNCVYKQLSKGQRGLLKLAFTVAVMKSSANRAGVHFNTLFFDESLDGLDTSLKVKAHRLFEELQKDHQTVMVIDHSEELKAMFAKRVEVVAESDNSMVIHHE